VELPLALTVGRWFLDREQIAVPVLPFGVAADEEPQRCAALGEGLASRAQRIGVLVVGDGTACRVAKAPGAFDERAEAMDAAIDDALADPSSQALAALDATLAQALKVDGRAAWQVAQAMEAASMARQPVVEPEQVGEEAAGQRLEGRVLRAEQPYGVHYVVATWGLAQP
jgi:aromatic ring-opening dioxygenase LigB subunit